MVAAACFDPCVLVLFACVRAPRCVCIVCECHSERECVGESRYSKPKSTNAVKLKRKTKSIKAFSAEKQQKSKAKQKSEKSGVQTETQNPSRKPENCLQGVSLLRPLSAALCPLPAASVDASASALPLAVQVSYCQGEGERRALLSSTAALLSDRPLPQIVAKNSE